MPSGQKHDQATRVVAIIGSATVLTLTRDLGQAVHFFAGALVGLVMSPDLDFSEKRKISPIANVENLFGKGASVVWWVFWYPYGRLINHRSFISHFPIFGTAVRILYLSLLPYLLAREITIKFFVENLNGLAFLFVGLATVDAVHYLMDNWPRRTNNE